MVLTVLLLVLAMLPSLRAAQGDPAREKTWRIGYEAGIPPISYAGAKGEITGFVPALLRELLADQGVNAVEVIKPWAELYEDFIAGRIDILAAVAPTKERRDVMIFSAPHMERSITLFYRKGLQVPHIEKLGGLRLATMRHTQSDEFIVSKGWERSAVLVSTPDDVLRSIIDGRADGGLMARSIGMKRLESLGLAGIEVHRDNIEELATSLHFGAHPGDESKISILNRGLAALRSSGEYKRLREGWVGPFDEQRPTLAVLMPYLIPVVAVLLILGLGYLEQRRLNQRLREGEERLMLALEGGDLAFWDWDLRTGLLHVSERWWDMLGVRRPSGAPKRQHMLEGVHEGDRARISDALDSMSSRRIPLDQIFRSRDGERWLHFKGRPLRQDPSGPSELLRAAGTLADITERKRSESEKTEMLTRLMEAQRLESLGILAGGVAHDFNNLLTVMLSNTALAKLEIPAGHASDEYLDQVETAAHRAARICQQMLACSGQASFNIQDENLSVQIEDMRTLIELTVGRENRLEINCPVALPLVHVDRSQLRQLILILVQNAVEACEAGHGLIRLVAEEVVLGSETIRRWDPSFNAQPGCYVCLSVSDNGCGMNEEVLARIWDPFYSTKFTGRGLGLPAVHGIVRMHHGGIGVESTPGLGTCFKVYLPALRLDSAPPEKPTEKII
jgi:signal transduction histidine kinase